MKKYLQFILPIILFVGMLLIYIFQKDILSGYFKAVGHTLTFKGETTEAVKEGEMIVDISDLSKCPKGRSAEQGGAALMYELPNPGSEGQYYIYVNTQKAIKGGSLVISYENEDGTYFVEKVHDFSNGKTDFGYIVNLVEPITRVYFFWEGTNKTPVITDFQMIRTEVEK